MSVPTSSVASGSPAPRASAPLVEAATRGTFVGGLLAGLVVTAVCNALTARVYDALSDRDGIADLDRPALRLAQRLRTPLRDTVAAAIAYVFGPVGMPILTGTAASAVSRRPRRRGWFVLVAVTGLGSLAITVHEKDLVRRTRPPHRDAIPPYEASPSFPSGHTLNATALSGILAWLEARRRGARHPLVAAYATSSGVGAVVGLSRVLLGAHWLTDVAYAWLAGTGWLTTVITVDGVVRRMRSAHPAAASTPGTD